MVVRHNVDRIETASVAFDLQYTGTLSDDAVPALVDALPALAPADRAAAVVQVCQPTTNRTQRRPEPPAEPSALEWNRAASVAAELRSRICR
jgi:hypothetical protein